MDEDDYMFEMMQDLLASLQADGPNGRMRVISKDPRFAADIPAAQKIKQMVR